MKHTVLFLTDYKSNNTYILVQRTWNHCYRVHAHMHNEVLFSGEFTVKVELLVNMMKNTIEYT